MTKPKPMTADNFTTGIPRTCEQHVVTPNTFKAISEILQSEHCIDAVQAIQENRDYVPHASSAATFSVPTTTASTESGRTYHNLDSKAWQGGLITVVSPLTPSKHFLPVSTLPATIMSGDEMRAVKSSAIPMTRSRSKITARKSVPPAAQSPPLAAVEAAPRRVSKGNTKPLVAANGERLSKEEEERVRMRRSRNKEAAARCRKRRVDQTMTLEGEVQLWEKKKKSLQDEIEVLKAEQKNLELILATHHDSCKLSQIHRQSIEAAQLRAAEMYHVTVKDEDPVLVQSIADEYVLPIECSGVQANHDSTLFAAPLVPALPASSNKLHRPRSLQLPGLKENAPAAEDDGSVEGVSIDTPSSIIPSSVVGFDLITGLTPIAAQAFAMTTVTPGALNTPVVSVAGTACATNIQDVRSLIEL